MAAGATWGMSAAAGADHRAAAPAWQDTQDEAQLETLRVALAAISAAEAELEQIRRHDEVHNHVLLEQEEELRERRQQVRRTSCLARQSPIHTKCARLQADRLEKADFVIDNSGDLDDLRAQVERAWTWIQRLPTGSAAETASAES